MIWVCCRVGCVERKGQGGTMAIAGLGHIRVSLTSFQSFRHLKLSSVGINFGFFIFVILLEDYKLLSGVVFL